ncbi:ABC-ATPase domain-containing protein [Herbivorax sp. ANBcel31]|uniref:ABC-ATPase domain-containing protein n=1 Tax=Herbivorax sp. ANBcel31 TaxID=3069754 RepID=UPI0027B5B997|nr:ABC-ATPase domain-containing protein [Herbivorax sp. ANBcel31]MDQ2086867.1 ABC-ATPase domain-containing protein [Herbivorax sp. ANBcel31]
MRDRMDLQKKLISIDGAGYKAYKDIKGQYNFNKYALSIDYVQGDPFASPSKARVIVSQKEAGFPKDLYDKPHKRIAVIDFLTRLFFENIMKFHKGTDGSGKSGMLSIDKCGQEILDRTSVTIDDDKLEARFEVGLPARGRRILGRAANTIFSNYIPQIVEKTLYYGNINQKALIKQVELSEDQAFLRQQIKEKNLVSFIANGSILPRESGISDRPLKKGAIPFQSPESLEIEINLPYKGSIKGMGVPQGVSLIVGGGYHGKSTLLQALELGVYDHISGDGREYIVTREDAVKIRAEDGRRVEQVNISAFINNLPNGQDTKNFSTENASGSTSQAANIIEALEVGTDLLLIDEDTSATNFMIRDERMQKLVSNDREPITPFIDKVKNLYNEYGVSTVLVVGGSGDYFDVADLIIMMDEYIPKDVTKRAKEIVSEYPISRDNTVDLKFGEITPRIVLKSGFPEGRKGRDIKAKGLKTILYNKSQIDLSYVEQLSDSSQTTCIAVMLDYMIKKLFNGDTTMKEAIDKLMKQIETQGLDSISPYTGHPGNLALPRKYEIAASINRYRLGQRFIKTLNKNI